MDDPAVHVVRSGGGQEDGRSDKLLVLAAAGFPLYWMFMTSMTPSAALSSVPPRVPPGLSAIWAYDDVFRTIPVAT